MPTRHSPTRRFHPLGEQIANSLTRPQTFSQTLSQTPGPYALPYCRLAPILQADMDLPEVHTHSFVIKIWLEDAAAEAGQPLWRGHITHVPTGIRRYFQDLSVIAEFVQPYLQRLTPDQMNN